MKLEAKDLPRIIHNSFSHSFDENGYLHLCRFTGKQEAVYRQTSPDFAIRVRSSASVTLDFITDSEFFAMDFDLDPGASHVSGTIDLYVDGVFWAYRYTEDLNLKQVEFALPAGRHRLTVYLPWFAKVVIRQVRLSEGACVLPVGKSCRLLAFGDSITQGYIANFSSLSYINQVAGQLNAELLNQGVGGHFFDAATLDEAIVSFAPDVITVAYGTNDYSHNETPEPMEARAGQYIRTLSSMFPNTPILGILPLYRNDWKYRDNRARRGYTLENVRDILRCLYAEIPNGYLLEETGIPHIPDAYAPDFLHPNDLGFTIMARSVTQKLQQLLAQKTP